MHLRHYQEKLKQDVYAAWYAGARNVLAVAATGSGKTVVFSEIIREHQGASIAIAHRHELVSQISTALARNAVRHRLIGSDSLPRICVQNHMREVGRSYYDPSAMCAVAGVDTLVRMDAAANPWLQQITLGIQDEAHHMLVDNKWGRATTLLPNARWLGVTATPGRADGKGLGRHADGIFDMMVEAPSMRDLINMGYLTDYRIFCPPSDLDLSKVPTSAGGDFSPEPLRKAVHGSHIVGDVVAHYKRLAMGKLGVTFAVDVDGATELASAYRAAGVPAEVVSAKTPDNLRYAILQRFKNREILQLVNVDLFGEGFDLPAIEVVSFARPTQSFPLFCQQFGRALRLMIDPAYMENWDAYTNDERLRIIAASNKPCAIIIDHVGNVHRHGLPDAYRTWTLDGNNRRSRGIVEGVIPVRTCEQCGSAYERFRVACPYCHFRPVPAGRSTPEQVDGDLFELSPEVLAKLRGEIEIPFRVLFGASPEIVRHLSGIHAQRAQEQARLRDVISQWGGIRTYRHGETISEAQRRFYHTFGIDIGTAQTLNRADAEALRLKIEKGMGR